MHRLILERGEKNIEREKTDETSEVLGTGCSFEKID